MAAVLKLAANWPSMASDTGTSSRLPNWASFPLTRMVAWPTSTALPASAPGSRCATRFIDADDPDLSAPLPSIFNSLAAASTPSSSMSPPNIITAGPTLLFTVPLKWVASSCSVMAAPGMHAAVARTSHSTVQACSGLAATG